jgi:hypothetical protein
MGDDGLRPGLQSVTAMSVLLELIEHNLSPEVI